MTQEELQRNSRLLAVKVAKALAFEAIKELETKGDREKKIKDVHECLMELDNIEKDLTDKSMNTTELAHAMYDAYGLKADWKTWDGKQMSDWEGIGETVRGRWEAAAYKAQELCTTVLQTKNA
jgi:hypothetical protein